MYRRAVPARDDTLLSAGGDFALSHPELHLGNIFVDEEFHVTCFIDWGSAIPGSVTELLATPGRGLSLPPSEAITAAFRFAFAQYF